MSKPKLLDLFCKAGGTSRGYQLAGFHVTGVDIEPQPRHAGDEFIQAEALEFLAAHGREFDAIHASPPCQGYSIMNNLPWLRGRDYPRLIKSVRELLVEIGKPWVIENVTGAKWGGQNLVNISERIGEDITDHGMRAEFLCGAMFGLPFYRHRLFETDWLWLRPLHEPHGGESQIELPMGHYTADKLGMSKKAIEKRTFMDNGRERVRRSHISNAHIRGQGQTRVYTDSDGSERHGDRKISLSNGAQAEAGAIGHAAGWRLAAEAMGIDWMNRDELTQAIPPVYTHFLGEQLIRGLIR